MKTFTSRILAGLAAATLTLGVASTSSATGGLGGLGGGLLDLDIIDLAKNLTVEVSEFSNLVDASDGVLNENDVIVKDLLEEGVSIGTIATCLSILSNTANITALNNLHDTLDVTDVIDSNGNFVNITDLVQNVNPDLDISDVKLVNVEGNETTLWAW